MFRGNIFAFFIKQHNRVKYPCFDTIKLNFDAFYSAEVHFDNVKNKIHPNNFYVFLGCSTQNKLLSSDILSYKVKSMRQKIAIILLAFLPFLASAQYSEVGIAGGISNYQGDLSGEISLENFNIGLTRGAIGILARRNFNRFFAIRGAATYGKVAADDARTANFRRNLSFESDIVDVAAIAEFNIFGYDPVYSGKRFSPYIMVGVAGYYFNPKTEYNGRLVALQPLGTEGQGRPGYDARYSRVSIAVPVGGGLKMALGDSWTIGIELGARKIFHDYLDDVSGDYAPYADLISEGEIAGALGNRRWELTDSSPAAQENSGPRGNAKFVDWYYFSMMTLTYHLTNGKGRATRSGTGCYKW